MQTTLDDADYRSFKEVLSNRGETLKEGLRRAIQRYVEEEPAIDHSDPIFQSPKGEGSGKGDLSERHDLYIYGEG